MKRLEKIIIEIGLFLIFFLNIGFDYATDIFITYTTLYKVDY